MGFGDFINGLGNFFKSIPEKINGFGNTLRGWAGKGGDLINGLANGAKNIHDTISNIPILGGLYKSTIAPFVERGINIGQMGGNLLKTLGGGNVKEGIQKGVDIASTLGLNKGIAEKYGNNINEGYNKGMDWYNKQGKNLLNNTGENLQNVSKRIPLNLRNFRLLGLGNQ